jgi:hypothetical protein
MNKIDTLLVYHALTIRFDKHWYHPLSMRKRLTLPQEGGKT